MPGVAAELALTVNVDGAEPLAGGVTDVGTTAAVTPGLLGLTVALSPTALLNPFTEPTVIVLVGLDPWLAVKGVGDALTVTSGVAGPPQLANLNELIHVLQLNEPVTFSYSFV